ncbi:P-loop containing nucleoside triphosphate hydrolase protein [Hypoxylon argillaceum]|nr:P-loop containing nucleoside triphosphate hydrolase protein [Hypoxylon argillaceum]
MQTLNSSNNTRSEATFKLPYRSLPYSRNHQFQFREDILQRLDVELRPGTDATSLQATGLHGLGGVGKTQVALEFAYRHSEDYEAIFWITAETAAKLRESLFSHVRAVMSTPENTPQQDTCEGRRVRWLIVFDNIEDEGVIEQLWPKGSHGSIILTSRNHDLSRICGHGSIEVPLFTNAESSLFMMSLKRSLDSFDTEEAEIVAQIAKRLGYLPLALDHIRSYIRRTVTTYRTFKQLYQDFDTNLLFQPGIVGPSYEKSIRNTWTMTLSTIDEPPRVLMETLALLDSDGVPIELFENCNKKAKMYNGPNDEFPKLEECLRDRLLERKMTDKAIASLLNGSLISRHRDGDRISCHRIVREAVLQSLSADALAVHFDWVVFALNACFPKTPRSAPLLSDWDRCAVFHPQISALLDIYNRFSASLRPPILLCEVVRRCAWYLFERGNFEGASSMLKSACSILETVNETSNHPGYSDRYICRLTADMYSTFGSIEYELNLPLHGRRWFEKADKHRRQLIEKETAEPYDLEIMAIVDGNIALTYLADGVPDSSIGSYKLLLNTFDSPSSRGIWAANLSIAFRTDNQLDESLVWCQKSLEWTSSQYGEQSLSLAIVYFNLGCTLISLRQDDEALKALETCLAIRQQKSPIHAYTGFTCHKIGTLLRSRGDLPRAATFFRSAIDILKDCESREGGTARSRFALAVTLEEIGDFDEAETYFEDVTAFMKKLGKAADRDQLTEESFEQFVLYCHR